MLSANDIFLHTLSKRYFEFLVYRLQSSLSSARDKEYLISEFALELEKINYEAQKHIFHEKLIKQFLHHYKMGVSVDATLQAVSSLQAQYIYADEPRDHLCCQGERSVLKFLAKYAAIERVLNGLGYRDELEEENNPASENDMQPGVAQNDKHMENGKRESSLPSLKIKRVKDDELTALSQEEMALFGFIAQTERLFLGPEHLNKVSLGAVLEAATGYSAESIRKSLSELPGSRSKSVKEKYQHIKELLLSMVKRIDRELGE